MDKSYMRTRQVLKANCPYCLSEVQGYKPVRSLFTMQFVCKCGCEFRVDLNHTKRAARV